MDSEDMLCGLPENETEHLYLLFEAGVQTPEAFQNFYAQHQPMLHSLYIHPQLIEFKEYGPWLLAVENKERLAEYLETLPGCVGVVASPRYLSSVAIQLSRGCTLVGPNRRTALVRFYASQVIRPLAECADQEWHAFLFRDITQWWTPGEEGWQPVIVLPSTVENAREPIIRLDDKIWQQIADKPDVSAVLREWQKMPASQHFPPCAQREMVVKALSKALAAGLTVPSDQKLYALYYLNGGKKTLESDAVCDILPKVSLGKISLIQVLKKISA